MAEWTEVTDTIFGGWVCSKCRYFDWPGKRTSFCPECGAKMKNSYNGGLVESVRLYKDIRKIKRRNQNGSNS